VLQKQNRRMQSNNTSGVKGVGWDKGVSKWRAYIEVENKRKHLGLFTTLKEAAEARNAVIKKYWPEEVWASNLIDLDLIKD
jgi:AP2 domain.